jgi:ribosomal protein L32
MNLSKTSINICDKCGRIVLHEICKRCGPWGIIIEAGDLQEIAGQLTIRVPDTPAQLLRIWG